MQVYVLVLRGFGLLQPLIADLVAIDLDLPDLFWNMLKT